ncbi:MAG TPA: hypothetical protein VIX86_12910 [Streptosporangiaceae bacterium]
MRHRFVFAVGLGVGYVLGARAGRERYEQLARLARKAADSPAVQQAAGAVQAQAADLAKNTRSKIADQMPKLAGAARSRVGATPHGRDGDGEATNGGAAATGKNGRPERDGHGPAA